jgi:hypothetical protein
MQKIFSSIQEAETLHIGKMSKFSDKFQKVQKSVDWDYSCSGGQTPRAKLAG